MPVPSVNLTDKSVFNRFSANLSVKMQDENKYRGQFKESASLVYENKKNHNGAKKFLLASASLAGAIVPLVLMNKKKVKMPSFKELKAEGFVKGSKEFIKNAFHYFDVEGAKGILLSGLGAIGTGFGAGMLLDNNQENKKEKIKELIHETSNLVIPTLFVAGALNFADKGAQHNKLLKNPLIKRILPTALALGTGIPLAFKLSKTVNKKIDKDSPEEKFRFKDCLVHLDDLAAVFVLTKVPVVDVIVDKALPFIYAKCGYEAGSAQDKKDKKPA